MEKSKLWKMFKHLKGAQLRRKRKEITEEETRTGFTFIASTRGSPMLVYKQFAFIKNRAKNDNCVYWRCAERTCTTTAKMEDGLLTIFGEHQHPGNEDGIRTRAIKTRVKHLALNTDAKPSDIIRIVYEELDENYKCLMDKLTGILSRFVTRARLQVKYKVEGRKRLKSEPIDGGVNYRIVPSQRGSDLLVYDGYIFHKNKQYNEVTRWICTAFRKGCKATCQLSTGGWLTVLNAFHTHERPTEEEIQRKTYTQEIRNRALNSEDSPSEIIKHVLPDDQYKRQKLLYTRCIQKARQRQRRKLTLMKTGSGFGAN